MDPIADGPPLLPAPRFFLPWLVRTDRGRVRYAVMAAATSLLPSLALAIVVAQLLPGDMPEFEGPPVVLVLGLVVFSPVVETLLMWPVLMALRQFFSGWVALASGSALAWGFFHSLFAPAWGLTVAWPFFVFTVCFLAWERRSRWEALLVTALVHALHNAVPALALVAGG